MNADDRLYLCRVASFKFCISASIVDTVLQPFRVFPLLDAENGIVGYTVHGSTLYFIIDLLFFFQQDRQGTFENLLCVSSDKMNLGILVNEVSIKELELHRYDTPQKNGVVGECISETNRYPLFNPLQLFHD